MTEVFWLLFQVKGRLFVTLKVVVGPSPACLSYFVISGKSLLFTVFLLLYSRTCFSEMIPYIWLFFFLGNMMMIAALSVLRRGVGSPSPGPSTSRATASPIWVPSLFSATQMVHNCIQQPAILRKVMTLLSTNLNVL